MSRTVILINPMGADVTLFVSSLLQGTILESGDSLYTLPYNNNAGATNIAGGVTLLDDKLNETSGDILVFAYSEGCQVVVKWMRDHGVSSPITPTSRLTFLLIANASRKFGGVLYGHPAFSDYADTTGLPAVVNYATTDFCRQYDGFADFPTAATDIQTALDAVDDPTGNTGVFDAIWALVNELYNNGDEAVALENAYAGMSVIHDNYFDVTVDDPANITYTEVTSPNVTYVWAPTYPVPMLGTGTLFSDQTYRKIVERFYNRPVQIPLPDYAAGVQVWSKKPPVTGWWPEQSESSTQTHLHAPPMIAAASMPAPKLINANSSQLGFTLPMKLSPGTGRRTSPLLLGAASMPVPVARAVFTAPLLLGAASLPAPSLPGVSPTFDVIGGGFVSASAGALTPPSFVLSDTGDGVVAFLQAFTTSASPTVSATVGGTAMTLLGTPLQYYTVSGFYALLFAFGLVAPPSGSKTVAFTISGPTAADYLSNAMSFHNVSSFGTPVTAFDSSGVTAPSMTVTSAAGKKLAQMFGGYTTTFSAYNQTQEYNQPLGAANLSAVMGYAAGASSVPFTAVGTQPWGGISVPVQ